MSKNDKKGKVNQVKANVTPKTSSDMGQNYSTTQNNSCENKKGEADQYRPLIYIGPLISTYFIELNQKLTQIFFWCPPLNIPGLIQKII